VCLRSREGGWEDLGFESEPQIPWESIHLILVNEVLGF
jgi:hypothetical protein